MIARNFTAKSASARECKVCALVMAHMADGISTAEIEATRRIRREHGCGIWPACSLSGWAHVHCFSSWNEMVYEGVVTIPTISARALRSTAQHTRGSLRYVPRSIESVVSLKHGILVFKN